MSDRTLIEMVEAYPILYDKKNSRYKDNRAKENAWNSIADLMGKSKEDVIKRWMALRKKFMEIRKKNSNIPSGSASDTALPKWPPYESMQFLNEHVTMRVTTSNIKLEANPESDIEIVVEESLDVPENFVLESSQDASTSISCHSTPASSSSAIESTPNNSLHKKRKLDRKPEAVEQAIISLGGYLESRQATTIDGTMAFAQSMGSQLKLIKNPIRQLQVQSKICQIIAEALQEEEGS